jgi:hypothetical protein
MESFPLFLVLECGGWRVCEDRHVDLPLLLPDRRERAKSNGGYPGPAVPKNRLYANLPIEYNTCRVYNFLAHQCGFPRKP